jgi:hypothetical protein
VLEGDEANGNVVLVDVDVDVEDVNPCLHPINKKLIMKIRIMLLYAFPNDWEERSENPKSQRVIDYNPRSFKTV